MFRQCFSIFLVALSVAVVKSDITLEDIQRFREFRAPDIAEICVNYTFSEGTSMQCKEQLNVVCSNATLLMTNSMDTPRVLSIQSHVVSGYVGNKSAVFALQLLGFEVDPINSVQLSNHKGYKSVKGQVLTEKDLAELVQGLAENDLDYYTHLLTGYIGSISFLNKIVSVVDQLRKKNPNLIYVCDPVMGDNGNMYVPKELLPIYKSFVVPLATIVMPNLYEIELLTGIRIKDVNDVWKATDILHKEGCEIVIVTSAEFEGNPNISIFASSKKDNSVEKFTIQVEKLTKRFGGCGDLFASLLLAWLHKSNGNLKKSLEKAVSTLQAVLQRTFDYAEDKDNTRKNMELKLIQSKKDIEDPRIVYRATIVE